MRSSPDSLYRAVSHLGRRFAAALLMVLATVHMAAPSPAAACTDDPVVHYLDTAIVDPSALPASISIGVGQDLVTWLGDKSLDAVTLESLNQQYSGVFEEDHLIFAPGAMFGVRNSGEDDIYVLRVLGVNETPTPAQFDLPKWRTVAYTVSPDSAVSFYFYETESIVTNFSDAYLADNSPPVELDAHMEIYADGEVYAVDFKVARKVNPEYIQSNIAMARCQQNMSGGSNPVMQLISLIAGSLKLSLGNVLVVMAIMGVVIAASVVGIVVLLRQSRGN